MQKFRSLVIPDFEYYISGSHPQLLVHSGTHGDEYEVIDIVKKCLEKYEGKLPDFLFVPKVSPSAVAAKTRFTKNNQDLNRIFYSDSGNLEVLENIKILKDFKFDMFVSFHEDPEFEEYYIYDQSFEKGVNEKVLRHNKFLENHEIKLLNGIDDPVDPHLGYEFINGYKRFLDTGGMKSNGATTVWAMSEKICKEALTPEIPGKLSLDKKEFIVETFFRQVLL